MSKARFQQVANDDKSLKILLVDFSRLVEKSDALVKSMIITCEKSGKNRSEREAVHAKDMDIILKTFGSNLIKLQSLEKNEDELSEDSLKSFGEKIAKIEAAIIKCTTWISGADKIKKELKALHEFYPKSISGDYKPPTPK